MADSSSRIECRCPACRAGVRVPPAALGRRGKCPRCGEVMPLVAARSAERTKNPAASTADPPPAARATPAAHTARAQSPSRTAATKARTAAAPRKAPSRRRIRDEILNAFSGDFPRPRLSMGLRVTSLFVAAVMLLLPVIYIGFAGGVGWLTVWHATHHYTWMALPGARIKVLVGFVYVVLILFGAVWCLSLLANLFVRIGSQRTTEGIDRKDEPLLYEFAEKLAEVIGAPRPDAIRLCIAANASASFETSLLGLRRKAFVLTIGVPLVAGLSLPQLAGVIAHEFGHFSQRGSTLLTRMIHRINIWFAAAAAGGDAADELIYGMTEDDDAGAGLALFGFLFWLLVSLGRGVLWCLMMFGVAVSSTLSRRMEFDADRYEAGVVGSKTFKASSRRLIELNVAEAVAGEYIGQSLHADHLPDNYPAFVAGLADRYPKVRRRAKKYVREERRSLLTTHPTTRSRIRAAERLNLPGIFHCDYPASVLFQDFEEQSQQLTHLLYMVHFREEVDPDRLRPTDQALKTFIETMT